MTADHAAHLRAISRANNMLAFASPSGWPDNEAWAEQYAQQQAEWAHAQRMADRRKRGV